MRVIPLLSGGLVLAVLAGGGSITAVGASRHAAFDSKVAALQREWHSDEAKGVPASSIAPLQSTLTAASTSAAWWSPFWWSNTGQAVLNALSERTAAVWTDTVDAAKGRAEAVLTAWTSLEQRMGQYVPPETATAAKAWPAALAAAHTPAALAALAQQWNAVVSQATSAAQAAQQTAQLNGAVAGAGGVQGLLATAQKAVSTAEALNLDTGQVPSLIAALQSQVAANADATATIRQLVSALASLQSLLSFNDVVAGGFRPLLLLVDQAIAEGDADGAGFQAQYGAAQAALVAATNTASLQAVQVDTQQLQTSLTTSLAANQCGHDVGAGKVITVNLTVQEIVFYDNGCAVQAAPVTTGRAQLRTPTGTFHIFYKQSPFQFISPWPPSSPFYYYPSWTNWVMEFAAGGYFIHDAPWESNSLFGPGSENSSGASHGCVHVPESVMQWAYSWTPTGTPVIITD